MIALKPTVLTSFGLRRASDVPPLDEDAWSRRERAKEILAAWQGLQDETDSLGESDEQGPPANPPQDLVMILLRMEERMVRLEAKLDRALAAKA